MAYTIKSAVLPRWKRILMALTGLTLAGCISPCCGKDVATYSIPTMPLPSQNASLQACSEHAAGKLQQTLPNKFSMLRLDNDQSLLHSTQNTMVGKQQVSEVLDGRGFAYFKKESRLVSFHCMTDASGTPLYTFVRPE